MVQPPLAPEGWSGAASQTSGSGGRLGLCNTRFGGAGQQAGDVLESLVIKRPAPEVISCDTDPRDLPSARGDGSYGNEPTYQRAEHHGFRLRAPKRGQARIAGIGRVRSAVERGHALLCQFGRVFRRLDRLSANYLGWVQLAACVIFIQAGFFR